MNELCFQDMLLPGLHKYSPNIAIQYGIKKATYRELDKRSQCVLNWLRENDVKKESFIGIYIEDKIDFISTVIGILKARCVFVPLDIGLPIKKIEDMVRMTHTSIIFSDDGNQGQLFQGSSGIGSGLRRVTINDSFYDTYNIGSAARGEIEYNREDKIYVYFTSGSTGTPKAVVGKNKSLLHFINWEISTFSIDEGYRISQLNGPEFDAFLRDVFVPLCAGGTICIPDSNDIVKKGEKLIDWIDSNQINLIHCGPHQFKLFNNGNSGMQRFMNLKYILLAGEKINPSELKKWYHKFDEKIQLVNLYGPTETTMVKTFYFIDKSNTRNDRVPIGKPMKGSRILILDKKLNICGEKTIGEIYIRTPYRTFGYYNDPQLTKERFIPNPFNGDQNDLLYKTGDLGRMLPDGNIEFVGRIDRQVKIKGVRVNPEEIEKAIHTHPAIGEIVVTAWENGTGETHLCAYYVSANVIKADQLVEYLSAILPSYMIPSTFVQVKKIPLLPNGKIDMKALPHPGTVKEETEPGVPGNQIERTLVKIWSEALEIDEAAIGINDWFTDLEGQSLKAIMISSLIHKEFNVSIPIHAIFELSTIKRLGGYIKKAVEDTHRTIMPIEKKEYYALSPGQKRLYIINRMEVESIGYNVPQLVTLEGKLDVEKLQTAFNQLINRHESLRTSFKMVGEEPAQVIQKTIDFGIEYHELGKGCQPPHQSTMVNRLIKNFIIPFNLEEAPLLRVGLIDSGDGKNVLMVDMHHIISDATSRGILLEDFLDLYEGRELPKLRLRYIDYSGWINTPMQQQVMKQQEVYWLDQFVGEPPVLNLPIDFPRPTVQSFAGGCVKLMIGKKETTALQKLAMYENATMFMVLLAVFNIFLSKISGQEDIIVGSPVVGRRHSDLQKIIGIFVNTLALRNTPEGGKTFKEFLSDLRKRSFNAFENQHYQFEDLVERVSMKRDVSRNPLFDVMFSYQEVEKGIKEISRMNVAVASQEFFQYEHIISKFDLSLSVVVGEQLDFAFEYCTKLFKKETIERFITYFKKILMHITGEPGIKLSGIEIISGEEKRQVLYDFNDTKREYPEDKTVYQLFEQQAGRTPGKIATIGTVEETRETVQLTYGELNKKSNQLAHVLGKKGTPPGSIIGIMMERSVEMIIGILGILKAGNAYLPIHPQYPQERIHFMLAESNTRILLTTRILKEEREKLKSWNGEKIYLDIRTEQRPVPPLSTSPPYNFSTAQPPGLAYVMYTSGSTGNPKGVIIEHHSLLNILFSLQDTYPFGESDTYLFKTAYVFDVSVTELFGWYLDGGRLAILENGAEKEPQRIVETIEKYSVTHINFVPSMFGVFTAYLQEEGIRRIRSLKYIFLAGEALSPVLVRGFNELGSRTALENIYGPTEGTIYSTGYSLSRWTGTGNIPIGHPLENIKAYILDRYVKLQPTGLTGELCLGGVGLSRGYLNRAELTAEKFVKNPYVEGEQIYRTGDLARWAVGGDIEYLGRIDNQIKIRGYRIELGEIENQLTRMDNIREAVLVNKEIGGEKYLCAYIVSEGNRDPDVVELKNALSKNLPEYMIPSYFILLDRIPLNPNGKIDKNKLPEPELKAGDNYTAPRDHTEKRLVDLWAEVLKVEKEIIGIDTDFFKLGGHSLKATLLTARIHKEFNVKITMAEIFKTPFIRKLSGYIKGASEHKHISTKNAEEKEYYELSPAQKRLYIIEQMEKPSTNYNLLISLILEGDLNRSKLEETFQNLINRHESLRTSFHMKGNIPGQKVHHQVDFAIRYDDVTNGKGKVETLIRNFVQPFDLSGGPLLKVGLIKLNKIEHILMIDSHHIVTDGISMQIMIEELMALYRGEELPKVRFQYKDYSEWQNKLLLTGEIKRQEDYWLKLYEGDIPQLDLPTDFQRPPLNDFEGEQVPFAISGKETAALNRWALNEEVTLFMLLLAAYNVFLTKLSNQEDILVGTSVAGRRHTDLESVFGMFVNTLCLRNYPHGHITFNEFLQDVKQQTLEAYENQDYQFEELIEKLAVKRAPGENPLFNVSFTFNNEIHAANQGKIEIPGLKLKPYDPGVTTSHFDLTLRGIEIEDKLLFSFHYKTALFEKETIEMYTIYFKRIISSLIENPQQRIYDIKIISESMKQAILSRLNGSRETMTQLYFQEELPMGRPILGGQALVLNKRLDICAEKTMGEIYIRIPYNASGYEDDPGLTPERFIPNLFTTEPNHLFYKTGYRGRMLPDGNIVSFGSIDQQPKVNTLKADTLNQEKQPAPPSNEIERTLVKIWSDVLEIDEASIGVEDLFTDLSGHSLKAIMMASWIHKELNVSIPIHAIFELSSIRRLAQYIKKSVENKYHTIGPTEEKEYYALSPGQKRLYVIKRMAVESIGYNVPQIVTLEGNLDIEKLENAFNKIIKRHESFRTSFKLLADGPVQKIHKTVDFSIEYYDPEEGREIPHMSTTAGVDGIIENFIRPFNLEEPPMLRIGLIKIDKKKYVLMADMHHIISDAASRKILLEDFLSLYKGKDLPGLRLQYKDYSEWVNSPARRQVIEQQELYWLQQFKGELPVLNLPTDFPRPKLQSFEGRFFGFEIGKKETTALQKLAMEENATLFMVLLAVFNVFLTKICGQEDILVGTVIVGRQHTDLEQIIGIFINTLVLRNYPRGEKTFTGFLKDLRKRSFNAFENQDYPFEELVDRLSVKRDMSRHPLFNVAFGLRNQDSTEIEIPELKFTPYGYENATSKIDMLMIAAETGENLSLSIEYNSELFKEETIEQYSIFFKRILTTVIENPGRKLNEIEVLPGEEMEQILLEKRKNEEAVHIDFDI